MPAIVSAQPKGQILKLLSIERSPYPGGSRRRELAKFSVEIDDDLRLCNLRLLEEPSGQRLVFGPTVFGGGRSATFSLRMAQALTRLASIAYDELKDQTTHAHHAA